MSQCKECSNVKPDDHGGWQCIKGDCRRKFLPLDSITDRLEDVLKARGAQISIVGNLLTAVIKLSPEELDNHE